MKELKFRGPIDIQEINFKSNIFIDFDPKKYAFDRIDWIDIDDKTGSYIGMVDKISRKPSGFGRFYNTLNLYEG